MQNVNSNKFTIFFWGGVNPNNHLAYKTCIVYYSFIHSLGVFDTSQKH